MKLRFCQHNQGAGAVVKRLQTEQPDLDIKLKKCLKQCSTCKRQPFAMLDGKRIKAEDPEELHALLLSHIVV